MDYRQQTHGDCLFAVRKNFRIDDKAGKGHGFARAAPVPGWDLLLQVTGKGF